MIDPDVIRAKINSIQNCLQRIYQKVEGEEEWFYDLDRQDIVVLNLQRAVQLAIDIAAHVVAAEKMGCSSSLKELFVLLERNRVLSHQLSTQMGKMVGFRNVAVHDYQIIDPDILAAIIRNHLGELEAFNGSMIRYVEQRFSH